MIKVVGLHKIFSTPKPLHVLKGIDLEIAEGEFLAVVGASGVGKSTFLHLLGGLEHPTAGTVYLRGQDLFHLSESQLAGFRNRKIGFIFQFHHLLPEFTALENTTMPALIRGIKKKEAVAMAEEILTQVGLKERLDHRIGELSGGEQQRVAVARALILHPELVLADEPTGNLDTQTGEGVFRLLKTINQQLGLTFVMVTHNEQLSSQADRVVRMVDGRIEAI